jgi:hypothetical protein
LLEFTFAGLLYFPAVEGISSGAAEFPGLLYRNRLRTEGGYMLYRIVLAWTLVLAIAVSTNGSTVVGLELKLNPAAPGCLGCTLSGPGTWNLLARDLSTAGDSYGIAGVAIPILNVNSVLNRLPRTSVDVDGEVFPVGFSLLRTANNAGVIPNGFLFGGFQDTIMPTPYLIRGYGQRASSFANELNLVGVQVVLPLPGTQTIWSSPLLLAEGTYAPGSTPLIDFNHIDLGVNVFSQASGIGAKAATLVPWTVPEPGAATLLMLAIAGVLSAKRQRQWLTPQ